MIFALIQVAAIAAVAVYFCWRRAGVRCRNTQSWESLLARLRPDWGAREWGGHFLEEEESRATPEEKWQSIQGAQGLWAMYENSCVMLEMADYAARNSDSVDRDLLAALRSDAVQIRVCVLMALGRYAVGQVNESICVNAFRAASMYTEMSLRMTELLQGNAGLLPDFVAAM
jgi:hypothetical protein